MFSWLRNRLDDSENSDPEIIIDVDGFSLSNSPSVYLWCDVKNVVCYKRDLLATDLICSRIVLGTTEDTIVELNEEMPGYDAWRNWLNEKIDRENRNWREKIVSPAFATNEMKVFSRR